MKDVWAYSALQKELNTETSDRSRHSCVKYVETSRFMFSTNNSLRHKIFKQAITRKKNETPIQGLYEFIKKKD